jgi:hypothetical protein
MVRPLFFFSFELSSLESAQETRLAGTPEVRARLP